MRASFSRANLKSHSNLPVQKDRFDVLNRSFELSEFRTTQRTPRERAPIPVRSTLPDPEELKDEVQVDGRRLEFR